MPIIIEGGSRSAGWWWARHLQNSEKNERAELVDIEGLSAETVPELFREMRGLAAGTKCDNYFYQANINPRADEHLTPDQWREAVEKLGRNLGLEGQPYFVIEHEKEGRTHRHVVWSRIDQEQQRAISDSLTARVHEQTSRELEQKFGLEPGRSVLVTDRDFERPERLASKAERFRGAQSGIDPHAVAHELKTIRERSDNGQSFRAGMEAAGYVLAQGDRRDFVVVDQAGHDHSLGRRLGMKAGDVREFMRDVDRDSLPRVADAKTRQHLRQVGREVRQLGPAQEAAGTPERQASGTKIPQTEREAPLKGPRPERPLNPTQAAIRAAWSLSRTADQLTEALAARGVGLACATAQEAHANQRRQDFAKELGRFVRPLREGEIVAIDSRGHVYHFGARTTGAARGDIEKRLAGIDKATLLSVQDTKAATREAARTAAAEARRIAREESRPTTSIEQTALKIDRAAADARQLAEGLSDEGIVIVRATPADIAALDALRRDQELGRVVAAAADVQQERGQHFARLEVGELAAVTSRGDVFRVNPQHLANIAHRLTESGLMPSITEARAAIEIERYAAATFRQEMIDIQQQRREAALDARMAGKEARQVDYELRHGLAQTERDIQRAAYAAVDALDTGVGRTGKKILNSLSKSVEQALDYLSDLIAPPPKLTPDQAERAQHAAEVKALDRADEAAWQEKLGDFDDRELRDQLQREARNQRLTDILGTKPTDEANAGRDEYERSRQKRDEGLTRER